MSASAAGSPTPSVLAIESPADENGRWTDVREAALTLFSERGYQATTMKDLATMLGMQAPSLYNHVVSKQEILRRIMTGGMARQLARQQEALAAAGAPTEQLRAMTEAHVLVHIHHRRSAMVVNREIDRLEEPVRNEVRAQRDSYEQGFRAVIQRGVEERAFAVDSVKLASFAIIEMATSVTVWFRESGPLSAEHVAREYGEMALRIVGAGRTTDGAARPRRQE
jgi:AcrR family transcriptional regulator